MWYHVCKNLTATPLICFLVFYLTLKGCIACTSDQDCGGDVEYRICDGGICTDCFSDSQCNSNKIDICRSDGYCDSPDLLSLLSTTRSFIGTILIFLGGFLAAGVGVGGGGVFIPVFMLVIGLNTKCATALTQATVIGGSIVNISLNLRFSHPIRKHRSLADINLVLLFAPMLLSGTMIGVLIALILPNVIITVAIIIILAILTIRTLMAAIKLYKSENEIKLKNEKKLAKLLNKTGNLNSDEFYNSGSKSNSKLNLNLMAKMRASQIIPPQDVDNNKNKNNNNNRRRIVTGSVGANIDCVNDENTYFVENDARNANKGSSGTNDQSRNTNSNKSGHNNNRNNKNSKNITSNYTTITNSNSLTNKWKNTVRNWIRSGGNPRGDASFYDSMRSSESTDFYNDTSNYIGSDTTMEADSGFVTGFASGVVAGGESIDIINNANSNNDDDDINVNINNNNIDNDNDNDNDDNYDYDKNKNKYGGSSTTTVYTVSKTCISNYGNKNSLTDGNITPFNDNPNATTINLNRNMNMNMNVQLDVSTRSRRNVIKSNNNNNNRFRFDKSPSQPPKSMFSMNARDISLKISHEDLTCSLKNQCMLTIWHFYLCFLFFIDSVRVTG